LINEISQLPRSATHKQPSAKVRHLPSAVLQHFTQLLPLLSFPRDRLRNFFSGVAPSLFLGTPYAQFTRAFKDAFVTEFDENTGA
jgi:hypothetical protein